MTVTVGEDINLTAEATGATSWEWYKNGAVIPGATGLGNNATLTIASSDVADSGSYKVAFTGAAGFTESDEVEVVVNTARKVSRKGKTVKGAEVG